MHILFDHNAPNPLIPFLEPHAVTKAKDAGWDRLADSDLLTAAERAGFDLMSTCDKRIRSQQNLRERKIALVVLGSANWTVTRRYVRRIILAVNAATPGTYTEVEIPYR